MKPLWITIDENGNLAIDPQTRAHLGLNPGARLRLEAGENYLLLHRPITQLAKIYIEPTNQCNLNCVTCIRNTWDEPMGMMTAETAEVSTWLANAMMEA
ncbi:MAG: hypothetical protein JW726_05635 [Anaerolineales bacterium]|nr:hypothetical protein [Anaerolineales bacterium]